VTKGNLPDYSLGALLKGTTRDESRMATIGAGWLDPKTQRISIKLDPFVVLSGSTDNMILTLFPRERKDD
jgi:hypothetical protein